MKILEHKLKAQDLRATDSAKDVAIRVLSRARNRPNFGNAGEVENVIGQAKGRYQSRQDALSDDERSYDVLFEPQDFDPEFDRDKYANANLEKLFADIVGCKEIVQKLGEYQLLARTLKARGLDTREQIPTNFVFKGPPGKKVFILLSFSVNQHAFKERERRPRLGRWGRFTTTWGSCLLLRSSSALRRNLLASMLGKLAPKPRNSLRRHLGECCS